MARISILNYLFQVPILGRRRVERVHFGSKQFVRGPRNKNPNGKTCGTLDLMAAYRDNLYRAIGLASDL